MTRRLYLDPEALPRDFAEASLEAASRLETSELRIDGAIAHRLRDVLRLAAGDALAVFDGRGHEREATISAVERSGVTLRLGAPRAATPEPPVPVTLACAFPRGGRGDWLVEKATELGVAAFAALAAERSVLRPGDGRLERWRRVAIEAAEQSGRAVVPTFEAAPPPAALRLVADLDASATIPEALAAAALPATGVVLYVGPEGGWSPAEREALLAGGARAIALGPRRLRVETAAIIGLAQVLTASGGL